MPSLPTAAFSLLAVLTPLWSTGPGVAQTGEAAAPIRELPHQRAFLDPRWGGVSFPITCVRTESQDYFDQGIAQLHTQALFEAARSFRWVVNAEPDCAMGYWGLAVAHVQSVDRAAYFMDRAVRYRARAGARERLFLDALARFYETTPATAAVRLEAFDASVGTKLYPKREFGRDLGVRAGELVGDYGAIVEKHPEDVEAMAFQVRQLAHNQRAGLSTRPLSAIDALIERLLQRYRHHPGHFYRARLWEQTNPARALQAVEFAVAVAPLSRSVWHLAGRLQARVGEHAAAALHFEAAARVDHARMARFLLMPFEIYGYVANLQMLCGSLQHAGRFRSALGWARYMLALPRHPTLGGTLVSAGVAQFAASCHAGGLSVDAELAIDGQRSDTSVAYRVDDDAAAQIRAVANPMAAIDRLLADAKFQAARSALAKVVASTPRDAGVVARRVLALAGAGESASESRRESVRAEFEQLRQIAGAGDLRAPVLRRLAAVAKSFGWPADWRQPPAEPPSLWPVRDLSELGPEYWRPRLPRAFELSDHTGRRVRSQDLRGRPHVVVFFIGNGCCLSCVPQLHLFNAVADAYRQANIDIAVVSFHTARDVEASMARMGEHGFPFLLLADPRMRTWHEWLTMDQYDHEPLYGTFLLDANGRVRWQDIGERPFQDAGWLLNEAQRLLMPAPGH